MERRTFLTLVGLGLCNSVLPRPAACFEKTVRAYGSGHFGSWVTDSYGLPAYHYTCDQITDRKAYTAVDPAWRSPTDHIHQLGNDRIVAAVSNYGYVQCRQDEGSPKFLNDYFPKEGRYGGGIGFLADEESCLSTYYSGAAETFDRVFGIGYLRKQVAGHRYAIDQVIFAPFGDDPVLVSQVTITNRGTGTARPRWVEYWGCQNYQFSYRALMEASILGEETATARLRREFCDQFIHLFHPVTGHWGLVETQTFRGRTQQEEELWHKVNASLKENPDQFYGGPIPPLGPGSGMEDLHPSSTFLISLDAPADGFATDAGEFFQDGIERPRGITAALNNDLGTGGAKSAFFLERNLTLKAGESQTLYFLYGYLPDGFDLESLRTKYSKDMPSLWRRSSLQWKGNGVRFRTDSEPWVERETAWSSYYLRSAVTYDSFFREHILSQGAPYQYIAGLQGAARDPLQHMLPLVFSDPGLVREVIRYTLKETQADGGLPYGIVGSGVPMPCRYRPSDLELWLLWLASEYVLATRDKAFLEEKIPAYPGIAAGDRTVRDLLERAYVRSTTTIGVGKHGLMRLFNGDWNDSMVVNRLPPAQVAEVTEQGESVVNAAMAGYVFAYYAEMLEFTGHAAPAAEAARKAEAQREAVRKQWAGEWFRRAWFGEGLGWTGDKQLWLEPQPWALIGGSATAEQAETLVSSIDTFARKPSPIGALLQSRADNTMKDESGVGTNGGIFGSINGTLIWALAMRDGAMAWDEWKKNTLARHADIYPDMWFGIWSGPDCYNSVLAKEPGGTGLDFPVMNMHSHAWPLYSASKLLGLEFHRRGVRFQPLLPLPQYEFDSPLLGFKKTLEGYSGWYAPVRAGRWDIEIELPQADLARVRRMEMNDTSQELKVVERVVRLSGESDPGQPLRWRLT